MYWDGVGLRSHRGSSLSDYDQSEYEYFRRLVPASELEQLLSRQGDEGRLAQLERAIHFFRQWSGRVSFLCDGIRGSFSPEQLAVFGPHIDDVLSYTPNKIMEMAAAQEVQDSE